MPMSGRWYNLLETLVFLVILIAAGVVTYSGIDPGHRRQIQLEAGLEQLRDLELAHRREHKHFFDPTDPAIGLDWKWIQRYQWEVEAGWNRFEITVRADLDGDGKEGVWRIDSDTPAVQRMSED
jgi:hypothetical protein